MSKLVTAENLKLGAKVITSDNIEGVLVCVDDLHNVEVNYDNGGRGLHCFVVDCEDMNREIEDKLYYKNDS